MVKENVTNVRMDTTVSISSADGWSRLVFNFTERFNAGNRELLSASVTASGSFWDRQRSVHSVSEAELTDDYRVRLPKVIFSEARLNEFLARLENWLTDFSEFEVDISGTSDQSLLIFIGRREDFISKPDRPVFSFKYQTSRMKAEWCFVTDYSCINLMLRGLKEILVMRDCGS
jgi:hypothetical protein